MEDLKSFFVFVAYERYFGLSFVVFLNETQTISIY